VSDSPGVAVRLTGVERWFGSVAAVRGIDLEIGEGEFFSLIGPSGCGKTTTLKMISGLDEPTAGKIEVHGRDMRNVPPHRRPVTTVFQSYALFPHLDVFENVAFGLREQRVRRDEIRARVRRMLDLVELGGRERARPRELSGGQQQRVALARALVLDPEVLLLDEPLGALDLKLRKQLQTLLRSVQREVGITFVYVTHDQEEAFSMSDRVAVMNRGLVEQVGRPREVYPRPATLFVADFVGASNRFAARIDAPVADDRYRVQVEGLGSLTVPGTAGLTAGQAAIAIVRPEQVRGGGGTVAFDGRVENVAYLGPAVHLTLGTALGKLQCVAPGNAEGIETATCFGFEPGDVWLVADGPAEGPA
jgi:spermidine/putrescine transport system ATP-binding protein